MDSESQPRADAAYRVVMRVGIIGTLVFHMDTNATTKESLEWEARELAKKYIDQSLIELKIHGPN